MIFRKILQTLFLIILVPVLSVAAFLVAASFKWANELPDLSELDSLDVTVTSQIFSREGQQIGEILPVIGENRETTNRIPVSLDEVSPAVLESFVAYEDDQFFNHYGFDLPGIIKGVLSEALDTTGRGGSTITTQVVKNTLLSDIASEHSVERKVKEVMLAVELERRLTKLEILQRYINVVFWGGQVYGIRSAAEAYFDKEPIELSLAQGLYLARLLPAPNARHKEFEKTRASMRIVLDKMVAQNVISADAARAAWLEPLQPRGWKVQYDGEGNIVTATSTGEPPVAKRTLSSSLSDGIIFAVRNWLLDHFGEELVFNRGGLRVYTTINTRVQEVANEVSANAEIPEGAQLAFVGLDPQTGEVLAIMGEHLIPGKKADEFNRALQAKRQPGSSFKPITYGTAIEVAGFNEATLLLDEETKFLTPGQPVYKPKNHDNKWFGLKTLRYHMDTSRNIPAILALEAATPQEVANRAIELGYKNVKPYYSIAIGSIESTPLQHAAAYGAFANNGVKMEPYFVQRVEDVDGNVLYEAKPRGTRVWTPQTAYIILDLLHANANDGIGFSQRAKLPNRWVGGKTGTTNKEKDIWFAGVTPGLVSAVWIGYDDGSPIPKKMPKSLTRAGDGRVNSSRQPVYVWHDFVEGALSYLPNLPEDFPKPDGIVMRRFDLKTGMPSKSGVLGAFKTTDRLRGSPITSELKIRLPIDTRTNRRATAETPREFIKYIDILPEDIDRY